MVNLIPKKEKNISIYLLDQEKKKKKTGIRNIK